MLSFGLLEQRSNCDVASVGAVQMDLQRYPIRARREHSPRRHFKFNPNEAAQPPNLQKPLDHR